MAFVFRVSSRTVTVELLRYCISNYSNSLSHYLRLYRASSMGSRPPRRGTKLKLLLTNCNASKLEIECLAD